MDKRITQDYDFCRDILPKVSRTFALNISFLSGSTYDCVLTAYLVCRILDTIEDAPRAPLKQKLRLFREFIPLLKGKAADEKKIIAWQKAAAVIDGSREDHRLVAGTLSVLRVFYSLDNKLRQGLIRPVSDMARGMSDFLRKGKGRPFLRSVRELERYCYYVAGTVGEMLTAVFRLRLKNKKTLKVLADNCRAFGEGLQLTNIIKDFRTDMKRGVTYIPADLIKNHGLTRQSLIANREPTKSRAVLTELIDKAAGCLDKALAYSLGLPRMMYRERIFCLLPLFMAMETLVLISGQVDKKNIRHKISRARVKGLLLSVPLTAFFNSLVKRRYCALRDQLNNV